MAPTPKELERLEGSAGTLDKHEGLVVKPAIEIHWIQIAGVRAGVGE